MVKRISTKKTKKAAPQQQSQAAELATFSLAAAIEEARTTTPNNTVSRDEPSTVDRSDRSGRSPTHNLFGRLPSPLRKKATSHSHQSLATDSSYNTANESEQNTPAASYYVESSEDANNTPQDKQEDLILKNREATSSPVIVNIDRAAKPEVEELTKTEEPAQVVEELVKKIEPEESVPAVVESVQVVEELAKNPEETIIMSKKSSVPMAQTATPVKPAVASTPAAAKKQEEAHFDVSQAIYSQIKDIWAWGKTVPVIETILGITESVASSILSATLHTTLPAIDADVAQPNLKKLDDAVVTPAVLAAWGVIGPVVGKTDEMLVKPVMDHVVPKIIETVGGKKDPDNSPNPEYTSAPMAH